MVRLDVQKRLVEKAFKENKVPFTLADEVFTWTGITKVKSNQTGRKYDITVDIALVPAKRLVDQLAACLCKEEGIRFEDLQVVSMIDPKIRGTITLKGLPREDAHHDFVKFIRKVSEVKAE